MRYHKVTHISSPEAICILDSAWLSLNASPVMCPFGRWFDIRRMTVGEVKEFSDDFMREISDEIHAGLIRPH
jgi:hypothetical protein